jgi:hypothetical protein
MKRLYWQEEGILPLNEQLELRDALSYNNEVRKSLYEKFISTGNSEYNRSYVDAGYTIKVFSNLAKQRN